MSICTWLSADADINRAQIAVAVLVFIVADVVMNMLAIVIVVHHWVPVEAVRVPAMSEEQDPFTTS